MTDSWVYKMQVRAAGNGLFDVRITTTPVRQGTRFDKGPGSPSMERRVDGKILAEFLADEPSTATSWERLRESGGGEIEIELPSTSQIPAKLARLPAAEPAGHYLF
jgi:hypothetical protein